MLHYIAPLYDCTDALNIYCVPVICYRKLKESVHDGTLVPATWNWNQKLSRICQVKVNI